MSNATPLYARVTQTLRDAIHAGRLPPGAALPSEKALEAEHGVSRITVRRALDELQREGLLDRGRGRQARVAAPPSAAVRARMDDDLAVILEVGRGTEAQVLSYAWRLPAAAAAAMLAVPADEPVLHVERLRRRRGQPVLHTLALVPAAIGALLPRDALADATMLDLLAARGVEAGSVAQEMHAAPCEASLSRLLDLEPGAPVFVTERLVRDTGGRAIQYMVATFRWDSFRYRMTSTRFEDGRSVEIEAEGLPRRVDVGAARAIPRRSR